VETKGLKTLLQVNMSWKNLARKLLLWQTCTNVKRTWSDCVAVLRYHFRPAMFSFFCP